jgi:hypothetical protein
MGGIQNRLGRSVVLFQENDLHVSVVLAESLHVAEVRASPSVDALVLISHNEEIAVVTRQQLCRRPKLIKPGGPAGTDYSLGDR